MQRNKDTGRDRFTPAYRLLSRETLAGRSRSAREIQQACTLCGRRCGTARTQRPGQCRMQQTAWVASYGAHHGEEAPLRGRFGSGTIFFSSCNLNCVFCQNADISQTLAGSPVTSEELAGLMLSLQDQGCHNINLVSPSHVVAEILEALVIAAGHGLSLPLVWNTGGYDSPEALALLDGIVDIYMPDMKYSDAQTALEYSGIQDYPRINQEAVREMFRQTGDLQIDASGIATRGLLVRHLVLPGGLAGTPDIVRFLAEEISTDTYLNLMDQYRPCHQAALHPLLNRCITREEYQAALAAAQTAGLTRLDERRSFLSFL
ncbi:MAG: radical SAM protein [Anaerolineales bacterium]|nr:radical SAM protein [Anaerolineales bacterium]